MESGLWMVDRKALETEAGRILDVVGKAGLTLRLVGSMAILRRCPNHAALASSDRVYRDIDFAGRKKEARELHEVLTRLGYVEDREVFVVSEGARAIFGSASNGVHVDVFYEKLDFCHAIPLQDRLQVDAPTLPLAELLLAKLQIVKVTEKDFVDMIALLLEHELGEDDRDTLNAAPDRQIVRGGLGALAHGDQEPGQARAIRAQPRQARRRAESAPCCPGRCSSPASRCRAEVARLAHACAHRRTDEMVQRCRGCAVSAEDEPVKSLPNGLDDG